MQCRKEGGWGKIKQIGYRMKCKAEGNVIVPDVMPPTKFVKNLEGHFSFETDLNLNGELSVPGTITKLVDAFDGIYRPGR